MVKKSNQSKTATSSENTDFKPVKMSLTVAIISAATLVILGIIAAVN